MALKAISGTAAQTTAVAAIYFLVGMVCLGAVRGRYIARLDEELQMCLLSDELCICPPVQLLLTSPFCLCSFRAFLPLGMS